VRLRLLTVPVLAAVADVTLVVSVMLYATPRLLIQLTQVYALSKIATSVLRHADSLLFNQCSIVQCAKHCLINTDGYPDVYYRVVSSCQLIVIASDNGQRANLLHDVVTNS
jgi:hypothetical protein